MTCQRLPPCEVSFSSRLPSACPPDADRDGLVEGAVPSTMGLPDDGGPCDQRIASLLCRGCGRYRAGSLGGAQEERAGFRIGRALGPVRGAHVAAVPSTGDAAGKSNTAGNNSAGLLLGCNQCVSWRRPWEEGRSPVGVLVGQDAVGELAELDQFVVVQPGEESLLQASVVGLLRLP
jgi:hypothetical protein